jgi:hypothetical protein
MARKKKIEISIPKPCHEKWSKMTPDGSGRFCSSCNETVIDFSKFTDRELIEYFRKKPVACGNFESGQLNRILTIPSENNASFLQKALFGTALLAGIASNSHGQTVNQPIPMGQLPIPNPPAPANHKDKDHNGVTIKGMVINHKTKEPISYLTVTLANSDSSAETDTAGKFSLYVPDSLKGKSLTVLCNNHYSYKDYEVVLEPGNYPQDMVISLKRKHHLFRRRHVRGRVKFRDKF